MSLLNLDRRKAQLVAARDLRDAISELRLIIAMVGLGLAIPIACAIGVRGLALYGGGTAVVNRLSLVGAFFVVFIPASFSLVLALESFVGERERTTLEVLLSTPLREAEIYLGKVVAVLTVSLALCYGGLSVYGLVTFTGLGYFPLGILLALALSTICQVAAMVAGAVIISLNARTMRAANVMASFIILPMSLVLQIEAALILLGRAEFLWCFALLMTVVAVVLLRMGFSGFSREALLARDVGLGHPLRRAIGAVRRSFDQRPAFPRLVWMRRIPMLLAALGFPIGSLAGYLAGSTGAALSSWTVALTGIVPNGLVEIPAAIIAGGLAIQVGATTIHMDASGGWSARVLKALADYVRALRWLVPALAVAAVLEVWLG